MSFFKSQSPRQPVLFSSFRDFLSLVIVFVNPELKDSKGMSGMNRHISQSQNYQRPYKLTHEMTRTQSQEV